MQHTPCPAAVRYRNPNASPIHSTNASQRPSTPLIPSHQSICSGRFTASPLVAGPSTCSCFGVSSFYHCPLSAPGSKPPAPSKAPVLPFRHSLKAKTAGDPRDLGTTANLSLAAAVTECSPYNYFEVPPESSPVISRA